MKPGVFRNVSAIMVRFTSNSNFSMLMDCGEGTFQQIYHHFGRQCEEILLNLKLIFITHKHGDHMLGLLKVLSEIDKIKQKKNFNKKISFEDTIYLIVPVTIIEWVRTSIVNDFIYSNHIIVIDNESLNPNCNKVYSKYVDLDNPYSNFQDVDVLDFREVEKIIETFMRNLTDEKIKAFYKFINKILGINFYTIEVTLVVKFS